MSAAPVELVGRVVFNTYTTREVTEENRHEAQNTWTRGYGEQLQRMGTFPTGRDGADVLLKIDVQRIFEQLAYRAARNKSRKATAMRGAVVMRCTKRERVGEATGPKVDEQLYT